jgi:hypothetical protein
MANDLTAWNNERFQVSFDVSAWGVAYDLGAAAWRFQARTTAASPVKVLDIPTIGTATYGSGVIVFAVSAADVADLAGDYEWDFGFVPPGGDFVRVDGGTLTFQQGVTR